MRDVSSKLSRIMIFAGVLGLQLMLAYQLLPQLSHREIQDFLLLSMGLAYIPLVAALLAAGALVVLASRLAVAVAQKLVPMQRY